jgi:hypothetical protein
MEVRCSSSRLLCLHTTAGAAGSTCSGCFPSAEEASKEEEAGMRQVSDEELIEMGMHDMVAQRHELLRKNAMEAGEEPPAPAESCVLCRETMLHMQREFDDEAVRTYEEVETYLGEMCDDMDGWYKPKVVQWCRDNVLQNKQMINGLVQMYSGNLVESLCALGLKVCEKDDPADLMFEQLEKGEEVVLERPTPGCLGAPGTLGIVKRVGMTANKKQYLVEAVDKSCESWYEEGYVARRNMSEVLLSTAGQDDDAKIQGDTKSSTRPTAKEAVDATAKAVTEEMRYPEAKKALAAAAKARRKAMLKVEDAEKALRKAERRLEIANEAYAAASSAAEVAKEQWEAADTVVSSVPMPDPQGDREL